MGKHSKEKKKINFKKPIFVIFIIAILFFSINFMLSNINIEKAKETNMKTTEKIVDNQKLVIKSKTEYNRIIEYAFKNDILSTVKMYEQFENKEEFEIQKKIYEIVDNIVIINVNEQELSIEIERQDLGSDAEMTYEQIYDKYLVQIVGAYEVVGDKI